MQQSHGLFAIAKLLVNKHINDDDDDDNDDDDNNNILTARTENPTNTYHTSLVNILPVVKNNKNKLMH